MEKENKKIKTSKLKKWFKNRKLVKKIMDTKFYKAVTDSYKQKIALYSIGIIAMSILTGVLILNPVGVLTVGSLVLTIPILCRLLYKLTSTIVEKYNNEVDSMSNEEESEEEKEEDKAKEKTKDKEKKHTSSERDKTEDKETDAKGESQIIEPVAEEDTNIELDKPKEDIVTKKPNIFKRLASRFSKNKETEVKEVSVKDVKSTKTAWCIAYGALTATFAATALIAATLTTTIGLGLAIPAVSILMGGALISGTMFNTFRNENAKEKVRNNINLNKVIFGEKEEATSDKEVVKNLVIAAPEKIMNVNNISKPKTVTVRMPDLSVEDNKKYRYVVDENDVVTQKMIENLIEMQTGTIPEFEVKTYRGDKRKVYTIAR